MNIVKLQQFGPKIEFSFQKIHEIEVDGAIMPQDIHRLFSPVEKIDLEQYQDTDVDEMIEHLSTEYKPDKTRGRVEISHPSWCRAKYLLEAIVYDVDKEPITNEKIIETALGTCFEHIIRLKLTTIAILPPGLEYKQITANRFFELLERQWQKYQEQLDHWQKCIIITEKQWEKSLQKAVEEIIGITMPNLLADLRAESVQKRKETTEKIKMLEATIQESLIPQLIMALDDNDLTVRANSASILSDIGEAAQTKLLEVIEQNRSPRQTLFAIGALRDMGKISTPATRILIALLENENETIRRSAGFTLAQVSLKKDDVELVWHQIESLEKALQSNEIEVRDGALEILRSLLINDFDTSHLRQKSENLLRSLLANFNDFCEDHSDMAFSGYIANFFREDQEKLEIGEIEELSLKVAQLVNKAEDISIKPVIPPLEVTDELVDLEQIEISDEAIAKVPGNMARIYRIFPIGFEQETLVVAVESVDFIMLDDLMFMVGCPVKFVLASAEQIGQFIEKYYQEPEEALESLLSASFEDGIYSELTESDLVMEDADDDEDEPWDYELSDSSGVESAAKGKIIIEDKAELGDLFGGDMETIMQEITRDATLTGGGAPADAFDDIIMDQPDIVEPEPDQEPQEPKKPEPDDLFSEFSKARETGEQLRKSRAKSGKVDYRKKQADYLMQLLQQAQEKQGEKILIISPEDGAPDQNYHIYCRTNGMEFPLDSLSKMSACELITYLESDEAIEKLNENEITSYISAENNCLLRLEQNAENAFPMAERLAAPDAAAPGPLERMVAQSTRMMRAIQTVFGLSFLLVANAIDTFLDMFTGYIRGIFDAWKMSKTAARRAKRHMQSNLHQDMEQDFFLAIRQLSRFLRMNQSTKIIIPLIPFEPVKPTFSLKLAIETRNQIDQMTRDLDLLTFREATKMVTGTIIDFFLSFIPNPLEWYSHWKDFFLMAFMIKYSRCHARETYEDMLLHYRSLIKIVASQENIDDRTIENVRHSLQRLLLILIKPSHLLRPEKWPRYQLLCEKKGDGNCHPLVALELEKWLMEEIIKYDNLSLSEKHQYQKEKQYWRKRYRLAFRLSERFLL